MGVDYRVLCFGVGLHLYRWPDDSDGDVQMIQYLQHAKDTNKNVQLETKKGVIFGKIEKIWWDDMDDIVVFKCDTGEKKQFPAKDVTNLVFL